MEKTGKSRQPRSLPESNQVAVSTDQSLKDRCQKLRNIMSPHESQPYGRSTNSLSSEIGVHLNVILDFLKTNGCPSKFDESTKVYKTEHLRKLAEWIDQEDEPVIYSIILFHVFFSNPKVYFSRPR